MMVDKAERIYSVVEWSSPPKIESAPITKETPQFYYVEGGSKATGFRTRIAKEDACLSELEALERYIQRREATEKSLKLRLEQAGKDIAWAKAELEKVVAHEG